MKAHVKTIDIQLGNGAIISMTLKEARELLDALLEVIPVAGTADHYRPFTFSTITSNSFTDNINPAAVITST